MPGRKSTPQNEENVLQDDFLDTPVEGEEDWMDETEGQLAVDVYQTKDNVVIKAPIAGVTPDKIDIEVAEDVVTIRGERVDEKEVDREHYYVQECYWGAFSRSVILPTSTIAEKAAAALKDGVLTITIPKVAQDKVKKIKVKTNLIISQLQKTPPPPRRSFLILYSAPTHIATKQ